MVYFTKNFHDGNANMKSRSQYFQLPCVEFGGASGQLKRKRVNRPAPPVGRHSERAKREKIFFFLVSSQGISCPHLSSRTDADVCGLSSSGILSPPLRGHYTFTTIFFYFFASEFASKSDASWRVYFLRAKCQKRETKIKQASGITRLYLQWVGQVETFEVAHMTKPELAVILATRKICSVPMWP